MKKLPLILIAAAAVFLLWRYREPLAEVLNPQALRGNAEMFRAWIRQFTLGPAIHALLYAVNTVTLLPPIAILSLAAGLAFGPKVGFLVIMAGAMAGTTATFFLSRRLGRRFVERRFGARFRSLDEKLKTRGFFTVFFFRMVPAVPYELVNYASGLSAMAFRDYLWATFLGIIPGAVMAAFLGDALIQPFSRRFLLVILAYLLYTAAVLAITSRFKKGEQPHAVT